MIAKQSPFVLFFPYPFYNSFPFRQIYPQFAILSAMIIRLCQ